MISLMTRHLKGRIDILLEKCPKRIGVIPMHLYWFSYLNLVRNVYLCRWLLDLFKEFSGENESYP